MAVVLHPSPAGGLPQLCLAESFPPDQVGMRASAGLASDPGIRALSSLVGPAMTAVLVPGEEGSLQSACVKCKDCSECGHSS